MDRSTARRREPPTAGAADPPSPSTPAARQRPHKPSELGPRLFKRGPYWAADLRYLGGGRPTLRDPRARGWPARARGKRTTHRDVAERWRWKYVDHFEGQARKRQLGRDTRAGVRLLGETVEEFLEARRDARRAPGTVRAESNALRTHLVPALGASLAVDAIERGQLQTHVDRLARAGYAPNTIQGHVAALHRFFAWVATGRASGRAVAGGGGGEANPAAGLVRPEILDADVDAFTDAELVRLRRAADRLDREAARSANPTAGGPRLRSYRLALELGLGTGGRERELLALTWGAFRQRDRTVRFTVQLADTGRGVRPLKGKRARTTLVQPEWWKFFDRARASREPNARVLIRDGAAHAAATASAARPWIQRLFAAAGVDRPGRGWHALRHTYARLFLERGGRLQELQRSLGHQSITTTERYYGHFDEDVAASAARSRIYGG